MTSKKRGLGRGLEALLVDVPAKDDREDVADTVTRMQEVERLKARLPTTARTQEVEQRKERLPTTARMQEVEQRREQLPTTARMQEVEQRREQLPTTARMQEVEQRREQLPTTARMQEVEQRREQLPRAKQASIAAEKQQMPVTIEEMDGQVVMAAALIKNIQRESSHLLEEAESLISLLDEFELMVRRLEID